MNQSKLGQYYEEFQKRKQDYGTVAIPERLDFIKQHVGTGNRVIELGCRSGGLLKHFVEENDVVGVDIDERSLAMCQTRFGIETHLADLNRTLPLEESEFDVVVMSEVLEHLPYPSISLGEIVRVMKPTARFVGSVPNGTRLRNRIRFLFGGPVELDPTHLFHHSKTTLAHLLHEYFDNVHIVQVSSRFLGLSRNLFANYLLFSCDSPKKVVKPHSSLEHGSP